MLITRSREMTEFDSLTCSETAKQMKGEQLPLCELSIIRYFIYTSSRSCTSHRNLFISISMYSVISIFYRKNPLISIWVRAVRCAFANERTPSIFTFPFRHDFNCWESYELRMLVLSDRGVVIHGYKTRSDASSHN